MIELALDPTDTRPARPPEARPARGARALRTALLGLVGAGALGGFGVAASTLMAGLAAPPPPVRPATMPARAADWPDLKDGLPALAGTPPTNDATRKAAEPEAPALRMASLPNPVAALPLTAVRAAPAVPVSAVPVSPAPAANAVPEAPTKRIPVPTPAAPIGPSRQATPLAPARIAAIQPPRPAETVRARDLVERAAPPPREAAAPPATPAVAGAVPAASGEKPARKAVAARRQPAPEGAGVRTAKPGDKAGHKVAEGPTTVAQAEDAGAEVLGIRLPSLAPAGRKLKEGVEAIGEAVRNVF